jgi:hypothetical protein
MSHTASDLALRVLGRLFSDSDAGSLPAADLASVKSFYHGQLSEMQILNLSYWDEDDIPDEAFEALTDFIAGRIAPDFNLTKPDLEASGTQRLRQLSARGGTGRRVTGEFF